MRDIKKYTEVYLNYDFAPYQIKYRRVNVIKNVINKYLPHKIMEIGCGMEPMFCYINGYDYYVVIEPSETFVSNARALLKNNIGNVVIKNDYVENVSSDEIMNLDCIVISSLLHEVNNPKGFMEKVYRFCDTGTVVHVNVPNAKSMHRLLAYECGLIDDLYSLSDRNMLLDQHSVFDIDSLVALLQNAAESINKKIDVLDTGSFFVKPFTHRQMAQCINQKIFSEDILIGFDRIIKYMPDLGSEIFVNFRLV